MNSKQEKILAIWKLLSEAEKKELLHHFDSTKIIGEYTKASTMNFGQTNTCPTCGK